MRQRCGAEIVITAGIHSCSFNKGTVRDAVGMEEGSSGMGHHKTEQKKIQEMIVVVGCKHSSYTLRQTDRA